LNALVGEFVGFDDRNNRQIHFLLIYEDVIMNSYLRKHEPVRQDSNLEPPQKRWRDHFFRRIMGGVFTVLSLGMMIPISSFAENTAIDIMVVYTENAKSVDTGLPIEDLIKSVVDDVNKSYEDSDVKQRLDKVHIKEISNDIYNDSKHDLDSILKALTNGEIGDVLEWRDKNLADLLILLVGNTAKGCGVAHQMNNNDPKFENSAFAVVKVGCAKGGNTLSKPYGFAHQLGHLMGCDDNSEKIAGKNTIMNEKLWLRTNRWSKTCATTLNETAKTVSDFRSPKPGKLQFSLASQKVEETVGSVTIEVTRTEGKNGQVSVEMKKASWGNATIGSDYTFTSPLKLTWDDWDDSPKKIIVPIIDDDDMEKNERAVFTLSKVTGGAKIGTRTTTITLTDNDGADIAYVIDVTGSMGFDDNGIQENGEITRTAKSLTDYTQIIVKQIKAGHRKTAPDINFVVFRDNFKSHGITNDLNVIQQRIDNLYAAGGDDCPEASVQAMLEAARQLRSRGQIMLFTDADPHPDLDIDAAIAELNKKGLRVHIKLSGVCKNTKRGNRGTVRRSQRATRDGNRDEGAIEIYSRIAFETGGSLAYIPEMNDGSASNGTRYENSIFNTMIGTDEPAIIDIAPSSVPQGGTLDLVVTATNTNFNDSTLVNFNTGIVVNEVEVISATQIVANVTVPSTVTPEFYNASVTTRLGPETETAEGRGPLLVVTPKGEAELLSVAPFTVIKGTRSTVKLSGLGTRFDETTTVDFGPGINVQDLTVESPTLITATLDITSDAQVGLHQVVVESGEETVEKTNAFLVLSAVVNDSSVSKITTVTPSKGLVGAILEVDIKGKMANFSDEKSVLDFSGTGISILSLDVMTASHAIATIRIDKEAALGYRDVFISTDEETATLLNGFEVADQVPEIKVKPNYASQGENQDIEIVGEHIRFVQNESIVNIEGSDVSVLSTTVNTPTQITAQIQVEQSAEMRERNISVITGSDMAVLRDGFKIFAKITSVQLDPLEELKKANRYLVWGLILDESEQPIVGVNVKLGEETAITDENGFWQFYGIVEGQHTIVATKADYRFSPKEVTLGNQAFITEISLTQEGDSGEQPNTYTAWGRIFNEEGAAIPGVTVKVGEQTVTTDETGRWEISGLEAGQYTVLATQKLHTFTSPTVTLGGMETTMEVKITLDSGDGVDEEYILYGTILDNDGNPVQGVTVQVGDNSALTNDNGEWEITVLSEGNYSVIATKEGFSFTQENVTVDEGTNNQEVNLDASLVPTGIYKAFGTIQDKFKTQIEGVTVEIYSKNAMTAGPIATTVSDESGYWEITGLVEGEYSVVATKDGYLFETKNCFASENQACEPVLSRPESRLNLTVTPQSKTVQEGENMIYFITVANTDDAQTATNIVVNEILPKNTQLVSISGNCSSVTCSLPDLAPGDVAELTVVLSHDQAKSLSNAVTVTSDQFPPDKETTWTRVLPYFSVSVTDQPDPVAINGKVQYAVNVALSAKAPAVASGSQLVFLLPNGVELQAINSDSAVCDTSDLPKLTCSLADIEPGNATASVNLEVELNDLGLLMLLLETQLSANEYPTHSVKTRTFIDISDEIEVDIAFVIDVTGSMQEEINGVKKALKEFIATIDRDDSPLIALITFKDNVAYNAFTNDMTVLLTAIDKLKAKGGGACPEASVEALKDITIPHVKKGGTILFVTDASPYPEADVEGTIALLRSKGIRFNTMITGDCSKESSWNFEQD
jgi:uncharacterized repeat protein (TIGR01451 family)